MSLDLQGALILFGVGAVAGVINTLAGGGSLLTLPVLIFLGLPAGVANGTNRVGILISNIGAVSSFRRHGKLETPWLRLAALPSVIGALVGMWLALALGDAHLQRVLAVVMIMVAIWILWNPIPVPPDGSAPTPPDGLRRMLFMGGFFLVGIYGGFLQAGVGFLLLALISTAGIDMVRGAALKVTLVLVFTPLTLIGFAMAGDVRWGVGLVLAAGNLLGAMLGVKLAIRKGSAWVRRFVVVLVVLFAVQLWLGA